MYFLSFRTATLAAFALLSGLSSTASSETSDLPCTIHSPNSGSFYDLRSISLSLPDLEKKAKIARTESWQAKGYDYNANFTLNVCAPVMEEVKDVVGIDSTLWQNVSAYYEKGGKTYSMGEESTNITFRGRKLVLQYINGSPCGSSSESLDARETSDGDVSANSKGSNGSRRKSTTISFHCEKEPLAAAASTSFIGTDPDECAYFFEVRSAAACGGAEPVQEGIGPGGVFGVIALIAVVVYFVGGIMYQRSVAHARGWRQLPNYSLWAGIASFFYVSLLDLVDVARRVRGPRVASVRDGILPTMEHRPMARTPHRSYGSRSSPAHYPP